MAEKIAIEIGLDGGQEVQRQLEDIGKSGQKAFSDIENAANQLDFSDIADGFQQIGDTGVQAFDKVKSAAQNAAVFEKIVQGINKVEGAFNSLGTAVERVGARMTRSLGPLGVFARALGPLGIALGVVGGAFVKFSNDTEKFLAGLTGEAAKLGLTAQQLDRLQQTLGLLGVSPDALADLQKLKESLGDVAVAFDPLKGEFIRPDVINRLQQVIAQLEEMPDSVARTQLAMKLLGDTLGAQVIAGLQTQTISAKNFADALGLVTTRTQEQLVQAQKYQQSINQMSAAWTQFKATVAAPILTPVFGFLRDEINNIKKDLLNLSQTWLTVKSTFAVGQILFSAKGTEEAAAAIQKIREEYQQATQKLQELQQQANAAGQTLQQAGQAGAQAAQQGAQATLVWIDGIGAVDRQSAAATQTLQQTGQAGAQAGQQVATGMQPANQALSETATQANTTAQAVQQVKAPEANSWTSWASTVIGALQSAIDKLLEWIGLKDKAGGGGGGGADAGAPGKARGGLIGGRGTGTSDSNLAWLSRGEFVVRAAAVRQFGASFFATLNAGMIPGFQGGGASDGGGGRFIRGAGFTGGGGVADKIVGWIAAIARANNEMQRAIEGTQSRLAEISESIGTIALHLTDALFAVVSSMQQTANELNRASGGALGGLVGGRGSSTSDSNLAWLSRGEFVMRAAAVRQFGAGFFAALNAGRIPGFALGGLVPRALPAFAGGGPVGGMSHVTIQFPGLPAVGGLRASSAVVEELQRAAALAQVRSGGRKPSRYS